MPPLPFFLSLLCAPACSAHGRLVAKHVVAEEPLNAERVAETTSTVEPEPPVDLTTATSVVARDTTLQPNRDLVIRFDRTANGFDRTASVSPFYVDEGDHARGQISRGHVATDVVMTFLKSVAALRPAPNATVPRGDSYLHRGTVGSGLVEAFLAAVVKHGLAPLGERHRPGWWTDDNPSGVVAVWTPDAPVVVLSYLDQRRRWRIDGMPLAIDPGETRAPYHASINGPYGQLLDAIDAHVAP